jgi:pantoate--beta-alanine ligase
MPPQVVRQPEALQKRLMEKRLEGKTIALVPTMGALHAGHCSLMAEGRKRCDVLVVSIFVNPTQFGPSEDLSAYPRTFDADLESCDREGVDVIFFPEPGSMYPEGFSTWVEVEGLTEGLCGATRPGHFRGVTTVVAKLFLLAQPHVAIFGWKDAQQLLTIRRMTRDLGFPVEIVGVDTFRESDGLAMSSRNRYLSPEERAEAPALYRALKEAERMHRESGENRSDALRDIIKRRIESESSARIDYIEIVAMDTLRPTDTVVEGNTLIALAAFMSQARLIDNIRL